LFTVFLLLLLLLVDFRKIPVFPERQEKYALASPPFAFGQSTAFPVRRL